LNDKGIKFTELIQRRLCCSPDLGTKCSTLGEVILKNTTDSIGTLWLESIPFPKNITKNSFQARYSITHSGIYYSYLINCKSSSTGTVSIDGYTTFMNPFGYLNGEFFALMPVSYLKMINSKFKIVLWSISIGLFDCCIYMVYSFPKKMASVA
jgi:hypothetical protein